VLCRLFRIGDAEMVQHFNNSSIDSRFFEEVHVDGLDPLSVWL
jgi:hypothetical protein